MDELAREVERATWVVEQRRWEQATGAGGRRLDAGLGRDSVPPPDELAAMLPSSAEGTEVAGAAARVLLAHATWRTQEAARDLGRRPVAGPRRTAPLSRVDAALAAEPNAGARAALAHQRDRLLHGERGLLADRAGAVSEAVAPLGQALLAAALGVGIDEAASEAEDVLAATDDAWRELSAWTLERRLLVPRDEATEADVLCLLAGPGLAAPFPAGGARLAAEATGASVGLWPAAVALATTDPLVAAEPHAARPAKDEVRLAFVASPPDGPAPWQEALRAVGTAAAMAAIHPDHGPALRLLLARHAEAVGAVLATLLLEPTWVARHAAALGRDQLRALALTHIAAVRLGAARTLSGAALLRHGPSEDAREVATAAWQRALGVPPSPWRWLWDTAPLLMDARRLRLDAAAVRRAEALRERFDEQWFRVPEAGVALLRPQRTGTPEPPLDAPARLAVRRALAALE